MIIHVERSSRRARRPIPRPTRAHCKPYSPARPRAPPPARRRLHFTPHAVAVQMATAVTKKRASAHVFTSEDAEALNDPNALTFRTYYCKFCGEHVLTTTADLSACSRRRTDGALCLNADAHFTRLACVVSENAVAIRHKDGTLEKRHRLLCGDVPVGYAHARGTRGRATGVVYIHPGALSAFDYERDAAGEGSDAAELPPPPCVALAAGGHTQVDLELRGGCATHAVTRVSASAVCVDVIGQVGSCDGALMEFLASTLGLRLAQMSLLRGVKPTARTLLCKGTNPRAAYAALRTAMSGEKIRASKIARGMRADE